MIAKAARAAITVLTFSAASVATAGAAGLGGSPESMRLQHNVAVENDYDFLRNSRELRALVAAGNLDELTGNANYRLARVSYPYAHAEVRLFVERLSSQYRAATGNLLVVTSLTRPSSEQPRNAHKLSVHPAGMAVDFRVPKVSADRAWLEQALLGLENSRVLDVTLERRPAHYHVAVFPAEYKAYVTAATSAEQGAAAIAKNAAVPAVTAPNTPTAASALSAPAASGSNSRSRGAPLLAMLGFSLFAIPAVILRRTGRNMKFPDRFDRRAKRDA
ncbi:MAG: DUF5715 family protein [Gemmatimonadaceae bacterium]